ncbi:DNA topoisomerase III [Cryptosporidium ubiquitum]|uniref:DNA topoisomerase n=1 Tax=Cryptosporidium ubiquitum TaxID=857276 RepID=A0A1J4MAS8_9CRYT|nr:DNA topoisomerase III [Cryptosporidium ubiquitum]OII71334.1 DNA topoisomerase III [Cryptosporidium ubiquitum]
MQKKRKVNLLNCKKNNNREGFKNEKKSYNHKFINFGSNNLIKNNKRTILCVAEKNSVAKEIASFLCPEFQSPIRLKSKSTTNVALLISYKFFGDDCNMIVTSVRGHLKKLEFLPKYSNWASVNPIALLDLSTPVVSSILPDCTEIADNLTYFSKISTYLILWLDCDREGENIAFEVLSICLNSNKNLIVFRAHFSAITKFEIDNAMKKLTFPNRKLSDAVEARKEIDLRVGSSFTRFLTLRYSKLFPIPEHTLSYGTCQFPTLGFVVDRYNKIKNFREENEWTITLEIKMNIHEKNNENASIIIFEWERGKIFDRLFTFIIYEACIENPNANIKEITNNKITKRKPFPLNTIEMTKIASNKLKITPVECINIAENLYRKGYISYPRTDTNSFSDSFDILLYIREQEKSSVFGSFASELLHLNRFSAPRKGCKNDGSHPPIHPVKCLNREQASSNEEWLLYELITRHFLSSCSNDAVLMESIVKIDISGEIFKTKGTVLLEENWLKIYSPFEKINTKSLPKFNVGSLVFPYKLVFRKCKTTPPSLLSEAELIDLMDKNRIGTDATMHEHIEKVQTRQYVKKNSKSLLSPTVLGIALYNGFELISRKMELNGNKAKLNSETKFHSKDTSTYNLMHFKIRQIIERYAEKIISGEYSRSYVVEKITGFMKHIYERMLVFIDHLDSALNVYFPKWDANIVVINGKISRKNISECGFCRSSINIYEIKKSLNGLPPISETNNDGVIRVSKNTKLAICKSQSEMNCKRPLFIPDYKSINATSEYCQHCGFKKIEIEMFNSKKISFCLYCFNFPNKCTVNI